MSTESYTPLYISEGTGLSVAQTYQLRENSRGIHTVRSFIHQRKSDPFQPQTAIGMANENYRRITSRLRLRKFELDYLDFTHGKPGADLRGVNTPVFMDVLY